MVIYINLFISCLIWLNVFYYHNYLFIILINYLLKMIYILTVLRIALLKTFIHGVYFLVKRFDYCIIILKELLILSSRRLCYSRCAVVHHHRQWLLSESTTFGHNLHRIEPKICGCDLSMV